MRERGRLGAGLALALALLVASAAARADGPRSCAERPHDERELDARIGALETYLDEVKRPTRAYWYTWVSALAAISVAQAVYASLEDDRDKRGAAITSAVLSGIGGYVVSVTPHPARWAADELRRMPSRTLLEKCEKVVAGEAWLFAEAEVARRATTWKMHIVAVVVGLAVGLGLGFGYDAPLLGVQNGAGAAAAIEARFWTRTKRAIVYKRRYLARPTAPPDLSTGPRRAVQAQGFTLGVTF